MEVNFVQSIRKEPELKDMKTNKPGGDREAKNPVRQRDNTKILGQATNGGLEKEANRNGTQLELASTKTRNKKESTRRNIRRNRATKLTIDRSLNAEARAEV